MKVDLMQIERAARRHRAEVVAGMFAAALAWIVSRKPRLGHAARPHFAR